MSVAPPNPTGAFDYYYYSYDTFGAFALDGCVPGCDDNWLGDGECDETCNVEQCNFDVADCFAEFGECYAAVGGSDYRGNVAQTRGGLVCQMWSHQWPHTHVKTHTNFPQAGVRCSLPPSTHPPTVFLPGSRTHLAPPSPRARPATQLGGHNHCRNPDGDRSPWCFTEDDAVRWDYCEVGDAEASCGSTLPPPKPPNVTNLALNSMVYASAVEHEHQYFHLNLPADIYFVEVVVVPQTGDPDIFVSFTNPLPSGANFTFMQEKVRATVSNRPARAQQEGVRSRRGAPCGCPDRCP